VGQTMWAPLRELEPPLPMSPSCSISVASGVDLVEDPVEGGAVWLHGMVAFVWDLGDDAGRRLAAAGLVATGAAKQRQVAEAFGVNETTVWRWRSERDRAGVGGLVTDRPGPKGAWKLTGQLVDRIVALDGEGLSGRQIARDVGVSDSSVRKVLAEHRGAAGEAAAAPVAAGESEEADQEGGEGVQLELLARPRARTGERQAARAGALVGAAPQICEGGQLPAAGALLALPALEATGLLEVFTDTFADQHDRPAFYDLRALVLTVVFACLLGEPRAQGLTRLEPATLGRLVGLDRVPEVKTLRRRTRALAALGRSDRVMEGLARRHLAAHPGQGGMFYVDGHVRAYHGKHEVPKAHLARMRISMPAEEDTWICDARGDGVLVWTAPPGASLAGELRRAVVEIRSLVGPDATPTIVFDRGGWSPKLFGELVAAGFELLTYRKHPTRPEPASAFADHTVVDDRGITHRYRLADRPVRVFYGPKGDRRYFACRQIVRLCEGGHQTTLITTRTDPDPAVLAHALFSRWRQENFFRYMRARFDLDALDTYAVVADDPDRSVPNPAKKDAARRIRDLKTTIAAGEATLARHRHTPALAASVTELDTTLGQVRDQLEALQSDGAQVPARVPLGAIRPDAARLEGEHKRLVDAIRMATYNAESSLAHLLAPHYRRARHEARSLLTEAFAAPADIRLIDGRMHITLNPMSTPARTAAIDGLCQHLTDTETLYPGTDLPVVYAIKTPADLA
jgi:prepilin-type processing-associated H-X9-DG protein